jgi:pimeloyl-ACP methyl ester carboxylesterase
MATFVISHGGWGGGWEWTPVARELRERGHEAFTPTLAGLGERRHRGLAGLGLSDHIEDVLAVLDFEQLDDVVLCGHSYSGMVVTGVADRAPARIRLLVHLDAFTPDDGQALLDLVPEDVARGLRESMDGGGIPAPPDLLPPPGELPEDVRTGYIERLGPQPAATVTDPVHLTGAIDEVPRAFVRCAGGDDMEPFGQRAKAEGWLYREVATPHDLQLFDPVGTAAVLDDLAHHAPDRAELAGAGRR